LRNFPAERHSQGESAYAKSPKQNRKPRSPTENARRCRQPNYSAIASKLIEQKFGICDISSAFVALYLSRSISNPTIGKGLDPKETKLFFGDWNRCIPNTLFVTPLLQEQT